MSVITLQFGQCGNQIGHSLYSNLYNDIKYDVRKSGVSKSVNADYIAESTKKWFSINKNGKWNARSILVDTDNKVAVADNNRYRFRNLVIKNLGGSANNWAFGFCLKSKLLVNDTINCLRKESEKCEKVGSILNILSSGGGTGSGVGSRVIERIRQEYPKKNMLNCIVLPFENGDVVTQTYNTLLTVSKVYDCADATLLFENDYLHRMCSKLLCLKNITLDNINSLAVQQLSGLLQPANNIPGPALEMLSVHPKYKLIQVKSAPHVSEDHLKYELDETWRGISNSLRSSLIGGRAALYDPKYSQISRKMKCLSNVYVTRGIPSPIDDDMKPLKDSGMYVEWTQEHQRFSHYHQPRKIIGHDIFSTLATNNSSAYATVGSFLDDSWTMFDNRAYVHHYKKYGIDEYYFMDSFDKVKTIFEDYKSLN